MNFIHTYTYTEEITLQKYKKNSNHMLHLASRRQQRLSEIFGYQFIDSVHAGNNSAAKKLIFNWRRKREEQKKMISSSQHLLPSSLK